MSKGQSLLIKAEGVGGVQRALFTSMLQPLSVTVPQLCAASAHFSKGLHFG